MKKLILFSFLAFLTIPLIAQTAFNSNASSSKMSILGTSTLHDWESVVEDFSVTTSTEEGKLTNINLNVVVKSIKSGKGGMDKNTYKAMKADQFPNIKFSAKELSVSGTNITGTGQLTIAGKTKSIPVNFSYEKWNNDTFQVIGKVDIVMSEYGIDPPTAMMGAIKTGDKITIKFEIAMNKQ